MRKAYRKLVENGCVEPTGDLQHCTGPSLKLLLLVLLSVPQCMIVSAFVFLVTCCVSQRNPTGLELLRSVAPRGKRPAPLEPLSSFCLGTNT